MNANSVGASSSRRSGSAKNGSNAPGLKALAQSKDKLLLDLKTAVDDAQGLMKEVVESSAQGAASIPAYVEDKLSTAKVHLEKVTSAVETQARNATAATEQYVKKNPWKSIGFASAVSLCISMLVVSASVASVWRTLGDKK
ncbi:MAG TPA: hypothetical protein VK663_00795 [Burkholderiales bacterium]|nr:hypothetical protein [Burkholderiales bacterium]